MSRLFRKKFRLPATVTRILAGLLFVSAGYAQDMPGGLLSKKIAEFEKTHSEVSVVLMKPENGDISYVYNPRAAFQEKFAPGSLAKVWSAVVLLEHFRELSFTSKPVVCHGKFFLPENRMFSQIDAGLFNLQKDQAQNKTYYRCSLHKGHGSVDLRQALAQSCNVYFLTRAAQNPAAFYRYLVNMWHLDANTGASIQNYFELPGEPLGELSDFQATASAIGEGGNIMVTPLKVAQTFSAFFAQTPLLVPRLENENIPGGARPKAVMQYSLNIQKNNFEYIYHSLEQVVTNGTLRSLKIKNGNVKILAGKTGTATHYQKKYATHAWNVIYFQYKNQRYILVSFVRKGMGSVEARLLSEVVLENL